MARVKTPQACVICGTMFHRHTGNTDAAYCSRACSLSRLTDVEQKRAAGRKGGAASAAKSRGTGTKGYVKEGGRHQHRVVAEEMLGRPLRPGEVVHHINEDKHDNRQENLHVFPSQRDHAAHHARSHDASTD